MKIEDWRKFGEIQYIRGRLDEMFKIDQMIYTDMTSDRIIDARISKYLDKLERLDPMAFELYHIERENIRHTIKRKSNENTEQRNSSDQENS